MCGANGADVIGLLVAAGRLDDDVVKRLPPIERLFLVFLLLSHSFDENSSSELLLDDSEHLVGDLGSNRLDFRSHDKSSSPPDSESESEQFN